MDFEKLKSKLQDLGRYFGGKKPEGDYDDDDSEPKGFFARLASFGRKKEATEDEGSEEAGDVQLSGGGHKPVYGIRRKIVGGAIVALMLTFALSYAFFNDTEEKTQQMKPHAQQHAANEPAEKGVQQQEPSYKELEAINRRNQAQAQQGAKPGQPNAKDTAGGTVRATPQTSTQTAQPVAQPQLSLPPTYSMPAVTPPSAPSEGGGAAAAKEKSDLEERFASAIDFALGTRSQGAAAAPTTEPAASEAGAANNTSASANLLQVASFSPASASPYVVQAGTLIPAILFSGINTDTPGQVIAQTSAPVYDSLYQTNLLIPAGSRLIGTYASDSNIANGRIHVKFTTVIFPTGEAFNIGESILAVDGGYNGIVGKVNRHTSRVISAGVFSSAIAALGSLASGNTNTSNTYSGGQLAMQGAMANLIQTTSRLFEAGANVQPTVTVEPGHTFQLFVSQPIAFGSSV